ncbi:MAG: hypothetical protein U5K74_07350 [Gemmatimonadaceae bacterium]|nr:hypothetical protein [Gemmatimonadaceae bacterium]
MIAGLAITEPIVDAIDRRLAGIAGEVLRAQVGVRPVGVLPVARLEAGVEEAAAAVGDAGVGRSLHHAAVAERGEPRLQVHLGRRGALQHDVDDARNGIRPVLRCGTVTQDLDPVDHAGGDRIQIDGTLPASDGAVDVDQGRGVPALAVDQHQHLIGAESAQCGRAHGIGAVRNGGAREVHGRCQRLNHLGRLGATGGLQIHRAEHVHRHRRLGHGPFLGARPDHGDRFEVRGAALEAYVTREGLPADDRDRLGAAGEPDLPHAQRIGAGPQCNGVRAIRFRDGAERGADELYRGTENRCAAIGTRHLADDTAWGLCEERRGGEHRREQETDARYGHTGQRHSHTP